MKQATEAIKFELTERLKELEAEGKLIEHQRLEQRTNFDLEMIAATGSCAGIENYSRFLTGRLPGEPPPTLFEYLPDNALLFVDESHQTIRKSAQCQRRPSPQIDAGRIWFRLPSAVSTTGRCGSTNGMRCGRRQLAFRQRRANGKWSNRAACLLNRLFAQPGLSTRRSRSSLLKIRCKIASTNAARRRSLATAHWSRR